MDSAQSKEKTLDLRPVMLNHNSPPDVREPFQNAYYDRENHEKDTKPWISSGDAVCAKSNNELTDSDLQGCIKTHLVSKCQTQDEGRGQHTL